MKEKLEDLYQSLYRHVGHHKQLLELVRLEGEILVGADVLKIQDVLNSKTVLLNSIALEEKRRQGISELLKGHFKKPSEQITLQEVIHELDGLDPENATRFRALLNTLTILVERITEQNRKNGDLIEVALKHVSKMRENIIGQENTSSTYTAKGKQRSGGAGRNLVSKEI